MSNNLYQSFFFLNPRANYSIEQFFVTESNDNAFLWATQKQESALIIGPLSAGKTHLAHIWAKQHNGVFYTNQSPYDLEGRAVVCDDADSIHAHVLFTLYNALKESGGSLLLTMRKIPLYTLKDWQSRLESLTRLHLKTPNGAHVHKMIAKILHDHKILCTQDILQYIIDHIPYSYDAVQKFINRTIECLPDKKSLSKNVVRQALRF
ncbi:MAG: hypothetical protein OXC30_00780 [Alphaproteobacteria bacterium]|nr:hypothetical protein [Alphaproteobacteria bacterium]